MSKNNQSTFNWGPGKKYDFCHFCYSLCSLDTPAVQLKKYPKCALKKTDEDGKKVNLNKYLKVRFKKWLKKATDKHNSEFSSCVCDLGRERKHQPCLLPWTWPGQAYWISQTWQRGSHACCVGCHRSGERAKTCWVRSNFVLHFDIAFFSN